MELYTTQLSKWRQVKQKNIPLLDTTVKSGDRVFAPSWNLVARIKAGAIDSEQYTHLYKEMMRESYRSNKNRWLEVAHMDRVAIACYCPSGQFCHRLVLVDLFKALCAFHQLPFTYCGEL